MPKKKELTHKEKLDWMAIWCANNGFQLELKGEVGFGRECVGICSDGHYPEYEWYDKDYKRIDKNGKVFVPEDAYHKGPYVAVLGRGPEAEDQLYKWLLWFDEHGFKKETLPRPIDPELGMIGVILHGTTIVRIVKPTKGAKRGTVR